MYINAIQVLKNFSPTEKVQVCIVYLPITSQNKAFVRQQKLLYTENWLLLNCPEGVNFLKKINVWEEGIFVNIVSPIKSYFSISD